MGRLGENSGREGRGAITGGGDSSRARSGTGADGRGAGWDALTDLLSLVISAALRDCLSCIARSVISDSRFSARRLSRSTSRSFSLLANIFSLNGSSLGIP